MATVTEEDIVAPPAGTAKPGRLQEPQGVEESLQGRDARADQERRTLSDELTARVLELAQANTELETFSFTVSHDLRTPLTIIANNAYMLRKVHAEKLGPDATKALNSIQAAVQRMELLIQNILHLSRVSRLPVKREKVDLSVTARALVEELREREPSRQVEVTIAEHAWAAADPAMIRVALANLLGNAWKFTSKSSAPRIEFGKNVHDGVSTYFVRDNGVGFDMANANRLFKLFERLHDVAEFGGTGIGLATVSRAITRHGGAIWADAAEGRGATFYFTLGAQSEPSGGATA